MEEGDRLTEASTRQTLPMKIISSMCRTNDDYDVAFVLSLLLTDGVNN